MDISLEQIKAGRALLDWTQKDLAEYANLNHSIVANYESGRTKSSEVAASIYKALIANGIEFTGGGVLPRQVFSYMLDSYTDLLEDIEKTLPEGGEVLKHCVDDRRSNQSVINHIAEMRSKNICERLTISYDNNYVTGDPKDYRQIPADYFASSEVVITYADKVAFFVDAKALVIKSQTLSNVFKDQFEYWWKNGKELRHVS
jgi:transcriptional regulator with XRE-family HTH domain